MAIYEFDDYRKFLVFKIKSLPGGGKGELSKIAIFLGVHASYLSQIIEGSKNLSHEQSWLLTKYLALDSLETRYFELLLNLSRASKLEFKKHIKEELAKIKSDAHSRSSTSPIGQPLDEHNQAIFYSSWHYSAIQLACGISGGQTVKEISSRLRLNQDIVNEALNFLINTGLCQTDGKSFSIGLRRTHLLETSPLRVRHQSNWRYKALEKMANSSEQEFFFTAPMRIDKQAFLHLRELVHSFIKEVNSTIDAAGDEELFCLNLDLFKW